MFSSTPASLKRRLDTLENHLRDEHPRLVPLLPLYADLDRVLRGMGLLAADESLTSRISWYPVITVVGQFSAGKSTFINDRLGVAVQKTGNQAVDDKFTVFAHGTDPQPRVLPGTALDADSRFPFHGMGEEIDRVAPGEGRRIDAFVQLKVLRSEALRGRILVDSPGFDSDETRASTLRLADHILGLSDLVIVMFDARKPEPGVMRDTLLHLVERSVKGSDIGKFAYVLNQIDAAAREDNIEDIFGAWQRTVARAGLISGDFYLTYSDSADGSAVPDRLRERRDRDMAALMRRIDEVSVSREYRVANMIETIASEIEDTAVPELRNALSLWRRQTWFMNGIFAVALTLLAGGLFAVAPDALLAGVSTFPEVVAGLLGLLGLSGHMLSRAKARSKVAATLPERSGPFDFSIRNAFLKSSSPARWLLGGGIRGWGRGVAERLNRSRENARQIVQGLNDRYSRPSGDTGLLAAD